VTNPYYSPGAERAAKVRELFDSIAKRYDLINDLQCFGFHRLWKRRLVNMANGKPGQRALDICCGTGDITLQLAARGLNVVGVDFSQPMLDIARIRLNQCHSARPETGSQVEYINADAQSLPFPDSSFDVVTVGYGLRNLASWQEGLREMCRVARPGATILVLDFAKPANPLWRAVYYGYLRLFVPILGWIFCGNSKSYSYILESLLHYPAQEGLAREMQALGLKEVETSNILGGVMSISRGRKP